MIITIPHQLCNLFLRRVDHIPLHLFPSMWLIQFLKFRFFLKTSTDSLFISYRVTYSVSEILVLIEWHFLNYVHFILVWSLNTVSLPDAWTGENVQMTSRNIESPMFDTSITISHYVDITSSLHFGSCMGIWKKLLEFWWIMYRCLITLLLWTIYIGLCWEALELLPLLRISPIIHGFSNTDFLFRMTSLAPSDF